jgi:hypothetical protein
MDDNGTALPLWYQGRGLREPLGSQNRERFRVKLAKSAGL